MKIKLEIEEKDLNTLISVLQNIDPTGIFIGNITGNIAQQLKTNTNVGQDKTIKRVENNNPVFGDPK